MEWFTGDIHGSWDISKLTSKNDKGLTRDDDLFISGDFGLVWNLNEEKENKYWRDWLSEKKYRTFFVPGNHENYDRLLSDEFPEAEMFGGKVRMISDKIIMLQSGYVYTIKDKKYFTFGGAQSIDKLSRKPHISWWEQEIPSASDFFYGMKRLEENKFEVDVVLSHATHKDMFYRIVNKLNEKNGFGIDKSEDPLLNMLQEYKDRLRYGLWVSGHYHMNCYNSETKTAILYNLVIPYNQLKTIVDKGNESFYLEKF